MKQNYFIISILFLNVVLINGQDERWTLGTANNLKKFYSEVGLFQPVRFGLTNRIEVQTFALTNIFSPNISFKFQWWDRDFKIATKHGIFNPGPGLNRAKNSGFKNWIGDTVFIPKTLVLKNELLISRYFRTCRCCPNVYLATFKMGVMLNANKNDSIFPPLEHALLYPRSDILNNNYLLNIGFDLEGPVIERLDFSVDLDFNRLIGSNTWSIEHKLVARYLFRYYLDFFAGYKLACCPNKAQKAWYFRPFIDAVYKFNIPVKPKNGLWRRGKIK